MWARVEFDGNTAPGRSLLVRGGHTEGGSLLRLGLGPDAV